MTEPPTSPTLPANTALPRVAFSAPNLDWLIVIALRHWRVIIGVTLAAGIGLIAALPFLTPQYEISAALLFKLGREKAGPALTGAPVVAAPILRTEDITTEAEIITSQALLENLVKFFGTDFFLKRPPPQTLWQHIKAVARSAVHAVRNALTEIMIFVGLEKRLSDYERVVAALQGSLQAEAVKRADVVDVKLLLADPRAGVEVMNKLIELYLAEHVRAFRTPGATRFLEQRAGELRSELADLAAERRDFSDKNGLWELDAQRKSLLLQQSALQQSLARTLEDKARTAAEIAHDSAMLARTQAETRVSRVEESNPIVQALQLRIVEQRAQLDKLRLVYGADSRRVQDETTALHELQKQLAQQAQSITQRETFELRAGIRDSQRAQVERRSRLAGLQAQEQRQREQQHHLVEQLDRLEMLGAQSRRMSREFELAEQSYQLVARRLEESRISDALDAAEISNVAVIGHPTASISPVRPRAKLLLAAALLAGLLGSFGFFVLRDALRPTLHTRDKAEQILGAPALARVPEVRR